MGSLKEWFKELIFQGGGEEKIITFIGSGGKTTLIWHLASAFSEKSRILVTPTTKMLIPPKEAGLYQRFYDGLTYKSGTWPDSSPGVTLAGRYNQATGKLESLGGYELDYIKGRYDLVLVEGDGSRGLPLKAWGPDEPVVPPFTGITVGVMALWPLGMPASGELIHRLPLFFDLTGSSPGDYINLEHLAALITGRAGLPGLFAKAQGKKILFFNQVEGIEALKAARELPGLLPSDFRDGLEWIIAGSVNDDLIVFSQ